MEASICEPLEHSARMMTLDDSPMEEMSDDEPLEHSIMDAAVTCHRVVGAPVRPPLQCSIMDYGPGERAPDGWSLRYGDGWWLGRQQIDGFRLVMGTPMDALDRDFSVGTWTVMLKISMRHFNGMPVYYGGDLYDSEDSDWDDPYALASAAYVEDYNFDVPEGMDLMVHRHSQFPKNVDVRQDCQMDVAPVYKTVSYATKDEWNTSDNDSLTVAADENDPDMNEFYQRVVSSDDENYLDSDNGSVTDFDGSMSEGAYCVVSDDGSAADLDVDMLDIVDYDDLDVWSVTDFSSCSSGVDVEDDCDIRSGS